MSDLHLVRVYTRLKNNFFFLFYRDENEEIRHSFANYITSIIFGRSGVLCSIDGKINEDEIFYPNGRAKKNGGNSLEALELTFDKLEENIHLSLTSKDFSYMQLSLLETLTNIAWCVNFGFKYFFLVGLQGP